MNVRVPETDISLVKFPSMCCCCLKSVEDVGQLHKYVAYKEADAHVAKYSILVPACAECQEHWKATEDYIEKKTKGEIKVWGPVAALAAFGAMADLSREDVVGWWWHVAFWLGLIAVIAAIGSFVYYLLFAPKSKTGHISMNTLPVSLGQSFMKEVPISFANRDFGMRFKELNADLFDVNASK